MENRRQYLALAALALFMRTGEARTSSATLMGNLPLSFEPNRGQAGPDVKFLSHDRGYTLYLTPSEAVLSTSVGNKPLCVRMRFVDANSNLRFEGLDELPGKANYFIGSDLGKWRANIPTYQKVRAEDIYPGIDLVYYGMRGQLEYDLILKPGADPSRIRIGFQGISKLSVNGEGDLVLSTKSGQLTQKKPVVYQEVNGRRREIAGSYVVRGRHEVGFRLAHYDSHKPLIVDPLLSYSTFLGGSGPDSPSPIAVDTQGSAYVAGYTGSTDFPLANPIQSINFGTGDVFVTKLNPSGSAIVYSTLLGGPGDDSAWGIAVDISGNAYITGMTSSANFPVVNSIQGYAGGFDGFVAKLSPTGALVYSTFLGGSGNEWPSGIALDTSGDVYVTGSTSSSNFPIVNPIRGYTGGYDAFVAKLHFSGSGLALVYSTYLGGSGDDSARGEGAIAVDASGNAYVVGTTTSSDFPTTAGSIQQAFGGGSFDVFVAKLNASGSGLLYSTFLGGNDDDHAWSIAVDGSGSAYVAGYTGSSNFPTVNPIQSYKGGRDAFVAKLNPVGGALVYSTYLGGSGFDQATRVAIDGSGAAYVVGETTSADFPTVNPFQSLKGTQDAFIARLDSSGGALTFSTYLGGTEGESSFGLALDSSGNAYVLGSTKSADYPTTPNAFQQVFRGGVVDAFVAKISFDNIPPVISGLPAAGCTLWPPNHKLVQVATVMAADSGSGVATFQVTGASNEPSDPKDPDIVITGSGSQPRIVQLRADRLGGGTGRVYTLTATATDQAGNTTTSTATCVVPHDQGN